MNLIHAVLLAMTSGPQIFASPAPVDGPRAATCAMDLNDNVRLYAAQLRTWIQARARAVDPGGVDLDTLNLRPRDAAALAAHEAWVTRTFDAVATGVIERLDPNLAQVLVREERRPRPEMIVLADVLSWDPVRGHAPTGDFLLVLPAAARNATWSSVWGRRFASTCASPTRTRGSWCTSAGLVLRANA